jgi:hypothetical protein
LVFRSGKNSGITWDEPTFREYIKDPKTKVPGTKMAYAGLKDEQKVNDLVAFLSSMPTGKRNEIVGVGTAGPSLSEFDRTDASHEHDNNLCVASAGL